QETALWRRIFQLPLADSRVEMTFPNHHAQHPPCLPPSLLVSAIAARPPHKPHCWLTNKINNPAASNRASTIPTTNERTGSRLGLKSPPRDIRTLSHDLKSNIQVSCNGPD